MRKIARNNPKRPTVTRVMRKLGAAIDKMAKPVVEKIAGGRSSNSFQVLISTMLSAQTRDPVTWAAATRLFKFGRSPKAISKLTVREIERLIYPVSFYRNKARHVKETCQQLISKFGGSVPSTMEELLALPGVGRKTANLVLILAHHSQNNICVDTHVHRIANRLGWVQTKTPDETEQVLYRIVTRRWWSSINLYLVTWGQNICKPVYPRCEQCVISDACPRIGVTYVGR